MEKIFHTYISYNNGRICGSGEYDLGYFRFPVNAWAKIIDFIENYKSSLNNTRIINGFVKYYKKGNEIIDKELYSFTVDDLLAELATGEVTYANINGTDYYFSVKPIKIED